MKLLEKEQTMRLKKEVATVNVKASELLNNGKITVRVKQLQDELIKTGIIIFVVVFVTVLSPIKIQNGVKRYISGDNSNTITFCIGK